MSKLDIVRGVEILTGRTAAKAHTVLVREGCSGSPNCAMEIYISYKSVDYLSGPNLHMDDEELEEFYQAVRAVRKARRQTLKARGAKGRV
jgi:hypothetical protein